MLFCAGLPVFFLEIALGQYAGVGPIKIFGRLAPVLKGLGYVSRKLEFFADTLLSTPKVRISKTKSGYQRFLI